MSQCLKKWDCLRTVNGSTSSTTVAHLWRTEGGLSVIHLTVNLSYWEGINDFFHPSLPHPVYLLAFCHYLCVYISGNCCSCFLNHFLTAIFPTSTFLEAPLFLHNSILLLCSLFLFSSSLIPFISHFYFVTSAFHPMPTVFLPSHFYLSSYWTSLHQFFLLLLEKTLTVCCCWVHWAEWSQHWILLPTHPHPGYFHPKQTIIFIPCLVSQGIKQKKQFHVCIELKLYSRSSS